MAQSESDDHADGVCDTGEYCPGSSHWCCKNTNPGGCGGVVEDTECTYDYKFRDSTQQSYKWAPLQSCWDWCTNYINPGQTHPETGAPISTADMCKVRKMLKTGQIFCGFRTGKYARLGANTPYPGRCTMFVSDAPITLVDYNVGGGSHNAGPYKNFGLTERPCNTNIDQDCAPDTDEQCAASGMSKSDAQNACSNIIDCSSGGSSKDDCAYDVCATAQLVL